MGELCLLFTGSFFPLVTAFFFIISLGFSYAFFGISSTENKRDLPIYFYDVVSGFSLYLLLPLLFSSLWGYLPFFYQTKDLLFSISLLNFFHLFSTFVCLLLYLFIARTPLGKYLWKKKETLWLHDIGLAIVVWPLAFFTMSFWTNTIESLLFFLSPDYAIQTQLPVVYLQRAKNDSTTLVLAVLLATIMAPVVEEFLFRGLLQNFCKKYMNIHVAIGVSSLIFAGFHYSHLQGLSNVSILSSLFVFSLFLGLLYEKRQSLLSSITLHALFNSASVAYVLIWGAT